MKMKEMDGMPNCKSQLVHCTLSAKMLLKIDTVWAFINKVSVPDEE